MIFNNFEEETDMDEESRGKVLILVLSKPPVPHQHHMHICIYVVITHLNNPTMHLCKYGLRIEKYQVDLVSAQSSDQVQRLKTK